MNTSGAAAVGLPEGLVAVVKRDCPTCELVAPVLAELNERAGLTVITQDDPHFPADAAWVVHDSDLAMSWHNDISTVPTLLRVDGGQADERTEGWSRQDWEELSGVAGLGATLPDWRPGCGSLSVDPLLAPELEIRFSGSPLRSRRVRLGAGEDIFEAMVDRGWSDGLPLVPPTEARVMRMLQGTSRHPQEVVTVAPPDRVDCTVEKVAVNAVMAGCAPEHLSVVLAAVEAVCTDEFNIHGVLATTMSVAPVLVVNGPVAARIGMNSGVNVLGQGNRANSTIGRAVQLVVRNVGGGRPGGVDRATFGSPAKVGFCFTEAEAPDGWPTLAESRGWRPDQSVVTAFCGEAPRILTDQKSRTPESLTPSPGAGADDLRVAPGGAGNGRDAGSVTRTHGSLHRRRMEPRAFHGRTRSRAAGANRQHRGRRRRDRRGTARGGCRHGAWQVPSRGAAVDPCRGARRTVLVDHRGLGQRAQGQRPGEPRNPPLTAHEPTHEPTHEGRTP